MGGAGGGRGQMTRALRLMVLLVLALAVSEYLFGSILEASSLRTYLYMSIHTATHPSLNVVNRSAARSNVSSNNTLTTRKINENVNVTTVNEKDSSNKSFINGTITGVTRAVIPLPFCHITQESDSLGPVSVHFTEVRLAALQLKFPELRPGGRYSPSECTAVHKVAIIVPFRNRYLHLAVFINYMHPFLMKQRIQYGIFIIEQEGKNKFNRAKLFNVGFLEAQRLEPGGWQCFIFHDVDLLPVDSRNLYTCPRQPRHMSVSIDCFEFRLPYNNIFGGVSAMTLEQFTKVNGFSNNYWGWGGEDDDMYYRLKDEGYFISRYKISIARYISLPHRKSKPNPGRYKLLKKIKYHHYFKNDGLSSLDYKVVSILENHVYTHIRVDIDKHDRSWKFSLEDEPLPVLVHRHHASKLVPT